MRRSDLLILFDIDGTLIRGAGPQHKEALIAGIRRVTGLSTTLDGVPTSGMLDRDLIRSAMRASGCSARRISALLPQIVRESERAYLKNCPKDLRSKVCPGAPELLPSLKQRDCVLGLVSGNIAGIAWKKMECAGLRQYFSVAAFSEDGATRAMLAKAAVQLALRKRLVTEPLRVVLVGDHPNDIQAAKWNGFGSVAVATGLISAEDLASCEPNILVRNLAELDVERFLDGINAALSKAVLDAYPISGELKLRTSRSWVLRELSQARFRPT